MIKTGILTFHRALNYGAVLQCFALKETLSNMGCDVEIIDYRPPYIEKYRNVFYWNDFRKLNFFQKIIYLMKIPFSFIKKMRASKAFDRFLIANFKISNVVNSMYEVNNNYDLIIYGSDQIWNPRICEGLDPVFWGQVPRKHPFRVSYAASMENYADLSQEQWETIKSYIDNFDSISVRENSLQKEIEQRMNHKVNCVLDPTLIISLDTFKTISVPPIYKGYIFLFTVQQGDLPYLVARKIAQENNLMIVRARAIPTMNIFHRENGVISIGACSPGEFIGLIQHSVFVVTNSFHATAISIKLEKDFYSIMCKNPERLKNVLKAVALEDRFITKVGDLNCVSKINYEDVNRKLSVLTKESIDYLKQIVNNSELQRDDK